MKLTSTRHLSWEACHNVRDTGGYDTFDGRKTRWGTLVRADSLCQLEPTGVLALKDYGIRTVVDLRSAPEIARAPHPFANHSNGVTYLNLPVLDESDDVGAAMLRDAPSTRELNAVIVERYPTRLANVIRAFSEARDGGVLVHCQVGKDRTGLTVALLLSLAGVDDTTVAEDYSQSDVHLELLFERLMQREMDQTRRERLVAQWSCRAESMLLTLEMLRLKYGGVAEYLQLAGVSTTVIERARTRLRE